MTEIIKQSVEIAKDAALKIFEKEVAEFYETLEDSGETLLDEAKNEVSQIAKLEFFKSIGDFEQLMKDPKVAEQLLSKLSDYSEQMIEIAADESINLAYHEVKYKDIEAKLHNEKNKEDVIDLIIENLMLGKTLETLTTEEYTDLRQFAEGLYTSIQEYTPRSEADEAVKSWIEFLNPEVYDIILDYVSIDNLNEVSENSDLTHKQVIGTLVLNGLNKSIEKYKTQEDCKEYIGRLMRIIERESHFVGIFNKLQQYVEIDNKYKTTKENPDISMIFDDFKDARLKDWYNLLDEGGKQKFNLLVVSDVDSISIDDLKAISAAGYDENCTDKDICNKSLFGLLKTNDKESDDSKVLEHVKSAIEKFQEKNIDSTISLSVDKLQFGGGANGEPWVISKTQENLQNYLSGNQEEMDAEAQNEQFQFKRMLMEAAILIGYSSSVRNTAGRLVVLTRFGSWYAKWSKNVSFFKTPFKSSAINTVKFIGAIGPFIGLAHNAMSLITDFGNDEQSATQKLHSITSNIIESIPYVGILKAMLNSEFKGADKYWRISGGLLILSAIVDFEMDEFHVPLTDTNIPYPNGIDILNMPDNLEEVRQLVTGILYMLLTPLDKHVADKIKRDPFDKQHVTKILTDELRVGGAYDSSQQITDPQLVEIENKGGSTRAMRRKAEETMCGERKLSDDAHVHFTKPEKLSGDNYRMIISEEITLPGNKKGEHIVVRYLDTKTENAVDMHLVYNDKHQLIEEPLLYDHKTMMFGKTPKEWVKVLAEKSHNTEHNDGAGHGNLVQEEPTLPFVKQSISISSEINEYGQVTQYKIQTDSHGIKREMIVEKSSVGFMIKTKLGENGNVKTVRVNSLPDYFNSIIAYEARKDQKVEVTPKQQLDHQIAELTLDASRTPRFGVLNHDSHTIHQVDELIKNIDDSGKVPLQFVIHNEQPATQSYQMARFIEFKKGSEKALRYESRKIWDTDAEGHRSSKLKFEINDTSETPIIDQRQTVVEGTTINDGRSVTRITKLKRKITLPNGDSISLKGEKKIYENSDKDGKIIEKQVTYENLTLQYQVYGGTPDASRPVMESQLKTSSNQILQLLENGEDSLGDIDLLRLDLDDTKYNSSDAMKIRKSIIDIVTDFKPSRLPSSLQQIAAGGTAIVSSDLSSDPMMRDPIDRLEERQRRLMENPSEPRSSRVGAREQFGDLVAVEKVNAANAIRDLLKIVAEHPDATIEQTTELIGKQLFGDNIPWGKATSAILKDANLALRAETFTATVGGGALDIYAKAEGMDPTSKLGMSLMLVHAIIGNMEMSTTFLSTDKKIQDSMNTLMIAGSIPAMKAAEHIMSKLIMPLVTKCPNKHPLYMLLGTLVTMGLILTPMGSALESAKEKYPAIKELLEKGSKLKDILAGGPLTSYIATKLTNNADDVFAFMDENTTVFTEDYTKKLLPVGMSPQLTLLLHPTLLIPEFQTLYFHNADNIEDWNKEVDDKIAKVRRKINELDDRLEASDGIGDEILPMKEKALKFVEDLEKTKVSSPEEFKDMLLRKAIHEEDLLKEKEHTAKIIQRVLYMPERVDQFIGLALNDTEHRESNITLSQYEKQQLEEIQGKLNELNRRISEIYEEINADKESSPRQRKALEKLELEAVDIRFNAMSILFDKISAKKFYVSVHDDPTQDYWMNEIITIQAKGTAEKRIRSMDFDRSPTVRIHASKDGASTSAGPSEYEMQIARRLSALDKLYTLETRRSLQFAEDHISKVSEPDESRKQQARSMINSVYSESLGSILQATTHEIDEQSERVAHIHEIVGRLYPSDKSCLDRTRDQVRIEKEEEKRAQEELKAALEEIGKSMLEES